jgi:hypothetical protein
MAMTGTRTVTAAMGTEETSPPEAIVDKHAPERVRRLPERQKEAITEIVHWTYGAGGGAMFGMLPDRVRSHPLSGPAYGLAIWLAFELAIAPVLGVETAQRHKTLWRVALALDHLLYGAVVGGRLAPETYVTRRRRRRSRPFTR